jgi:3-oxoacyl-[acyl-carrier protein] reductase
MALAIITGASRGLGFENAKSLAALGHDIVMIAKDSDRLSLAQQNLQSQYPSQNFSTYAVDLEDMSATRKTVEQIAQQHLTPEIMILAHGVMSEKMSKTLKTTDAEWRRVMAIN